MSDQKVWDLWKVWRESEEAEMTLQRAQDALWAAIADQCTCTDRDPTLPPLAGHEPDCSLQNTGWLS